MAGLNVEGGSARRIWAQAGLRFQVFVMPGACCEWNGVNRTGDRQGREAAGQAPESSCKPWFRFPLGTLVSYSQCKQKWKWGEAKPWQRLTNKFVRVS